MRNFFKAVNCLVISRSCKQHKVIIILCAFLLTASLTTACNSPASNDPCDFTNVSSPGNGIAVSKASNGEYIGISNGWYAFDTKTDQLRSDGDLKCQASTQLRNGNTSQAVALWEQAHKEDTSDAEALIYLEDQKVANSPHVTFVVATALTGSFVGLGRDNLQGAYVAQKEYNDESQGTKVRLLIANFGSDPSNAVSIARQIVRAAQADKTIVGVMGFPLSAYATQALPILQQAHLPVVSPGASADALSGKFSYFFRVVPSDSVQASTGVDYAVHTLHTRIVALIYDPHDVYSNNLATDVRNDFSKFKKDVTLVEEAYSIEHPEMLNALLTDALSKHADLLYFTTYATDLNVLLVNLPSSTKLVVMGSDNFYQVQDYSIWSRSSFTLLQFTAFAYPDEWNIMCERVLRNGCIAPPFFQHYISAFDDGNHDASPYGFKRADSDTIVSYDALGVLLRGYQLALAQGQKTPLTPSQEQHGLQMISGANSFPGISGQIAFKDGDPVNKAIVLLYVDASGFINVVPNIGIKGCFFAGHCSS